MPVWFLTLFTSLVLASQEVTPNPVFNKDSAQPPELSEKKPESIASWEKTSGFALAIGVPHPLTAELNFRTGQTFGIAFTGGWLPFSYQGVSINYRNTDFRMLFFPGRGRFYIGLDFGYEWLSASSTQSIDVGVAQVPMTLSLTLKSPFVIPVAGFMFVFKSGFMLGFEFGLMHKFSTTSDLAFTINDPTLAAFSSLVTASSQYQSTQTSIQNAADMIGSLKIPHFTLLRLGWMF